MSQWVQHVPLGNYPMINLSMYFKDVEQHSMENIVTDTRQLEKDNNMMKTELENRIEDLAKQTKSGGDNKVR